MKLRSLSISTLFLAGVVVLAMLTVPTFAESASGAESAESSVDVPTYSSDVASILHSNCAQCHRPGQGAPMSLLSYEETRPWAKSIARKVENREMPPWHATGGIGSYVNDRSLGEGDIRTLVAWAKAGAPAGDLAAAPAAPKFQDSKWKLGEPDLVVDLEEVTIAADGPDVFKNLVGKVGLKEDKWITAVEILPGNSEVVHHVITYSLKGFDFDPTEGWLGAWAAGTDPMVFPEGTGRLLKAGSNLIGDMHYHPSGTEATDLTKIGLHFSDAPPKKELTNVWIMNANFKIPAGDANHQVIAKRTLWQSGKIMGFAPHMHYRGKDFKYVAHFPNGKQETLLEVDNYDFNWQTNYVLEEPIAVPAGTVVECIAHFDNSAGNEANPDPTIDVTFGDESYDEMMIGFLDFIVDEGVAPLTDRQIRTRKITELQQTHSQDLYRVSGMEKEKRAQDPDAYAPLYLPRAGEGEFWVIWNDQLTPTPVTNVEWNGDSFTAKLASPFGDFDLEGEIDGETIKTVIKYGDGNSSEWDGERISGP